MKATIEKLGEGRIFFITLLIVFLTHFIFENTEIKEVTVLKSSTVILIELIVVYPIRFLFFGIHGFKITQLSLPKLNQTAWISISILIVGLLICGTYYFVNKDNGRYQYERGLIIDKKTGEAKKIHFEN